MDLLLVTVLSFCALATVANSRPLGGCDSTAFAAVTRRNHLYKDRQSTATTTAATPLSLQQQRQQCAVQIRHRTLPLHVMKPLDEMASAVGDSDEDDDDHDDLVASPFLDLDSLYNNNNDPTVVDSLSEFDRDEDEILTEREDRFYIDEKGERRKVEKCILVGVDDLSAKRKLQKRMYQRYANEFGVNGNSNGHSAAAAAAVEEEEDMLFTLEESLVEMRELIKTAGLECVAEITQRLQEVNPKTYVGSGKVLEAMELMEENEACTIVFDAELTPGQQKALENAFNKKVIQNDFLASEGDIKVLDRTALILDIFAQHAKTREGKLQVDLALHEYRKPRLTRMWTHLERQSGAGGVGLRGPGESQLEIDKRLIRDRIITLKQKIDEVQKQRSMHRQGRSRTGLPILSLVGYTNSGKSTLLNHLTKAGVMAESMLFATLDPTTRKVQLPGLKTHPSVLLTDTVGFVQKLPTHLVAAFRATLEEVQEADVLVHVIDVSNPTWQKQERAVLSVLADMDCTDKPIVRVLNKIDLLDPETAEYLKYEAALSEYTVAVSSLYGDGITDFVSVCEDAMLGLLVPIEAEIPYHKGDLLNDVHEKGHVEVVDYRPNGTYVMANVPRQIANRLEEYSLSSSSSSSKDTAAPQKQKRTSKNDDDIDWVALGRGRHSETKK